VRSAVFIVLVSTCLLALLELASFLVFKIRPSGNPLAFPAKDAALHIYESQDTNKGHYYSVKRNYEQIFRSDEFYTVVKTNNLGWRESFDYNHEEIDIAFVGDSFTFGHGVNEGERYSDWTRMSLSPDYFVANFSPANGSAPVSQYLYLLQNQELLPKHLVVGLFAWNDLREDMSDTKMIHDAFGSPIKTESLSSKVRRDGFIVAKNASDEPDPAWKNLLRSTNFGSLILLSWHRLELSLLRDSREASGVTLSSNSPKTLFEDGVFDATALESLQYVARLKDLVEHRGGNITVLYIPASYRVGYYPYFCEYISGFTEDQCKALRTTNGIGESIADWCRRNDVQCLDPTNEFRSLEASGRHLYFPKDGHWNEEGHRSAGSIISEYLKRRL